MLFKTIEKVNIKKPDKSIIILEAGVEVDLPEKYITHPKLEVVTKIKSKVAAKKKNVVDLDLNKDGKVDKKDYSIMGRELGKRGRSSKKKVKK